MGRPGRRAFLTGTVASMAGIAGCVGLPFGSDSSAGDDGRDPGDGASDDTQSTSGGATTEADPEGGEGLRLVRDAQFDDGSEQWQLVNGGEDTVLVATVRRTPEEGRRGYLQAFQVKPGGVRTFQTDGSDEPEFERRSTWTERQYQPTELSSDVTGRAVAVDNTRDVLEYELPNPTDIPTDNVQEVTATALETDKEFRVSPDAGSDGFEFSSPSALWTQTFRSEVAGVSGTETFTWTVGPPPRVDITVDSLSADGIVENPEITYTARSATPVFTAETYIGVRGPNTDGFEESRYRNKPYTRATDLGKTLFDAEAGEGRIGTSRTLTFGNFVAGVDFPVTSEDVLVVGLASVSKMGFAFPVASVERPIQDLV